jgi:hypothetical protein
MILPDSFGAMMDSKYMKKEDTDTDGVMLTIAGFDNENVAPDTQEPEHKWIIRFEEQKKGLVMNTTAKQALAGLFGSPKEAIGQRVCVYVDPNVSFGTKKVGGLRLRAATKQSPRQPSMADINRDLARAADDDNSPPF